MTTGLFLGLTTVDLLFGLSAYPDEDTKSVARRYLAAAGGPATNAAVAFAGLGGQARLLSSVRTEGAASIALEDLRVHGVEHCELRVSEPHPPVVSAIAINETNGSRTILTSPSIDADASFELNAPLLPGFLAGCDVLMLDGHQVDLAVEAARIARSQGIPVVLDGDLYRPGIERLLPSVDAAIFGKSFSMPDCSSADLIMKRMRSSGIRHVAATQGGDSILFTSDEREGFVPVAPVTAVDTLAAGDFFHGAFCFHYGRSPDFEGALRFASEVATRSVESWGPREWLKSL